MVSDGARRQKRIRGGLFGGKPFGMLGNSRRWWIPSTNGRGVHNPSIGSMLSNGIMKQNRQAGGNNVCRSTAMLCNMGGNCPTGKCCKTLGPAARCPCSACSTHCYAQQK